jgi:phosphoesterase RecJ-like protein
MTLSVNKAKTSSTGRHIDDMTRIEQMLRDAKRVLVVSHLDPDGDAIGSQLAFGAYLADCGKTVFMLRDAETPGKYAFLANTDKIQDSATLPEDFAVDTAVVLECPNRARIGHADTYLRPGVKIVNIDHHPDADAFGDINWFDTGMSSVGEMICEYFRHVDYAVSPEVAEALYTAMLTDTGRFRYASTTQRTMELAGSLITAGADPQYICERVYYNMPIPAVRLHGAGTERY